MEMRLLHHHVERKLLLFFFLSVKGEVKDILFSGVFLGKFNTRKIL